MRIVVISNYSLLYGANRSMLTILEHLKAKGHDLLVILPSDGPITSALENSNIEYKVIRFLPSFLYVKFIKKHLLVPILFFYNILVLPKLVKTVKSFSADLIYSNTSAENIGIIIAKILNLKHVSHIREFMSLDHGAYFVLGRRLKRWYINLSNGVIFVSKAVAEHVLIDKELDHFKHEVIYNGIKTPYSNVPTRVVNKPMRFGSVGVLQPSKGHIDAINYFKYLHDNVTADIELHIFGEGYGNYQRKIEKLIIDLKLSGKVFLHGFVKDPKQIYDKIDVLCVFSRSEGFGRVTVEAMQRGVPVLALNKGGSKELIINSTTGFLINDLEDFVKAYTYLNDSSLYALMSKSAFNYAREHFSDQIYTFKVETFLNKILNNE